MLNNLYNELVDANPKDVFVIADFDDCLDVSTVRNLTPKQKQILWDLHTLTDGGFVITTNSDGRSVFEMSGMDGYPVISEFATTFRNIDGFTRDTGEPTYYAPKPDAKSAFNAAVQKANELGVTLVETGEELASTVGIKLEEKEQGIAAVFGSHTQLTQPATEIVERAFEVARISSDTHEIDYAGKDAREIKAKGAKKSDVIDHLQSHPLMQRKLIVAMGDSGSDWDVMKRVGRGIVVGDAINDEKMQGINHIRILTPQNDFSKTWDLLKTLRDSYSVKTKLAQLPRHARVV